jgi:hypothetical protein
MTTITIHQGETEYPGESDPLTFDADELESNGTMDETAFRFTTDQAFEIAEQWAGDSADTVRAFTTIEQSEGPTFVLASEFDGAISFAEWEESFEGGYSLEGFPFLVTVVVATEEVSA